MSNPVHTSETRMCGDLCTLVLMLPGRQVHRERSCVKANYVQPSRLVKIAMVFSPRASSPSSSMRLGYS